MHKFTWVLLFLLLGVLHTQAQKHHIRFENITIDEGLAQSTITDLLEDQKGFMWFATAEGLHRYDGYSFKIFKTEQGNPHSLSDNYLTALAQDKYGNIYIGANDGSLCKLWVATGSIDRLTTNWKNKQANPYQINHIQVLANQHLLLATDGGGLFVVDTAGNLLNHYDKERNTLPNNYVHKTVWHNGELFICTQHGLEVLRKKYTELDSFAFQYVTDVLPITNQVYYVTTMGQGLYKWDKTNHTVHKIELPRMRGSRYVACLAKDKDNEIWIGTNGGGLMRIIDKQVYSYVNDPLLPTSLVGDKINKTYIDSKGNLWLGTISGISKFDKSLRSFGLIKDFIYQGENLNNNVYSIYQDKKQQVWFGTITGGLVRYSLSGDSIDQVYPLIKDGPVETKAVRTIYEDRNHRLWIGTRDQGLFELNREKHTFKHYKGIPGFEITHPVVRCVFEDSRGRLWVGTGNGLNLFDPEKNTFTPYRGDPKAPNHNQIYDIKEDPKTGNILVASFRGGLQIMDAQLKHVNNYRHNNTRTGPSSDNIMCIEWIGNGQFMLGTYGGGVSIYDSHADTFGFITEKNGLVNNVVYGILPGLPHEYWFSTNRGICRYNHHKKTFKNYGLNYYIQSYEYNEGAYCKTYNGLLFFGGIKGVNFLNPGVLNKAAKPTNLVVTTFKLMDKAGGVEKDLTYNHTLEISHNANLISFDFAALGFANLKDLRYAYKLEGYDKDWIASGNRRTAYYTRLAPGKYTFKVKTYDVTGNWQMESQPIQLRVPPPFWMQSWFLVLLVILGIAVIGFIIHLRTQMVSRRFKQRQVELELQALRSQMNPHFIFNSLNSIQYFILQKEPKTAYTYLTKFAGLMRMILQNSRQRYISLQAEKDWLLLYLELEKLRMENELDFSVDVDEKINVQQVLIPTMLVQPYVENAIIHGLLPKAENRKIAVRFSLQNNMLRCEIEDNGIGRTASASLNEKRNKKHTSSGMTITNERLEILSQEHPTKPKLDIIDLEDQDKQPCGTLVAIDLPIILHENHDQA